uniref:Uncharacterized protein n=1 Tax=Meloidogyne enterolobii TaxID=390850 RepID=A0A6V7WL02_MELEN|nr:unnamed protein product [Meloidogyne enterolobii]
MKIARYLFRQIFKCFFRNATLDSPRSCILNPKMIELLFEENKTNMDLNIHSQFAIYSLSESTDNEKIKYFLTFALNHLISNELRVKIPHPYTNIDKNTDILFEILTNGGNQFSKVSYWYPYDLPTSHKLPKIYNTIIEKHQRTFSKMVKEIKLREHPRRIMLSARAENIEIKVINDFYNFKSTKYQLSNKYNTKLKFSICNEESNLGTIVEIKRII